MRATRTRPARLARWIKGFVIVMLVLVIALVATAFVAVRASLPRTDGAVTLSALSAPVTITRDVRGVPTITGQGRLDVFRGQGYVHAQDRYFQMDLWRSLAAGELAALVGDMALEMDRSMRKLGYRRLAGETLPRLPASQRAALDAYTEGVNAGLADLGARPPEYFLLGQRPRPWTAEDSVVILFFFYAGLSYNHVIEKPLGVMQETLPSALFDFLTPDRTRFDTPLVADGGDVPPLEIPGPDVVDLRGTRPPRFDKSRTLVKPMGIHGGSNGWVVAGSRTGDGRAILANDTHMTLSVPNTWYRATLLWGTREAHGVGPAGVPGITAGASRTLAWGVTNSGIDHMDWIIVESPEGDASRYLTPDGPEPFTEIVEELGVRGGETERMTVRQTRWGPVVDEDW
jgi:penicillin amidase